MNITRFRILLLVALLGYINPLGAQVSAVDARGKTLALPAKATRVISLAPSITELLFSAGAQSSLVGAVDFSNYPAQAAAVARVGSYANFDYEAIVKLKPDLIIGWQSGNPAEKIRHLEQLGLRVFLLEPRRLNDLTQSVASLAQLAGDEKIAAEAIKTFNAGVEPLQLANKHAKPVRVFYQIWHQPLMTLNNQHLFNEMLASCGGVNVFGSLPALAPKIDIEAVIAANPDVIIASGMDEARPQWLDQWQRWPMLKAVKNGHLFFIPPDLLQRQSLRAAQGISQLCAALEKARQ
jgi:iron complex transport system substrate-binding protein